MSALTYPLHRTTRELLKLIRYIVDEFELDEFTLGQAIGRGGSGSTYTAFLGSQHDWDAALAELERQGYVRALDGGRLRVVGDLAAPLQSVRATLALAFGTILDRHRSDAQAAIEAYATLYLLENGLRDYIAGALSASGPGWWERSVPRQARDRAQQFFTARNASIPASERRDWATLSDVERLSYVSFDFLTKVIVANWDELGAPFPSQVWLQGQLEALEPVRNNVAHSRPLSRPETDRLTVFADALLAAIG